MRRIPLHERSYYPWIVFAIGYGLMILSGFTMQSLPPLFETIRQEIPFSHTKAGLLMGAYGLAGLFLPLVIAGFARKLNQKRLMMVALWVIIGGLILFAASRSYPALFVGRALSGGGGVVLAILTPLFINRLFPREMIGKVIGLFNTGFPVGFIAAVNFFPFGSGLMGWRFSILVIVIVAIFLTIVFGLGFQNPLPASPSASGNNPGAVTVGSKVWLLVSVNVLVAACTLPFTTFVPEYLAQRGMTTTGASLLISFIMLETSILGPFIGILVDRTRMYRQLLLVAGLFLSNALVFIIVPGIPILVSAVFLGAASAIVPVAMFPLLKEVVSEEQVGMGLAFLIVGSNMGSNIGLGLFGILLDHFGGFVAAFIALSSVALLLIPVVMSIRIPAAETGQPEAGRESSSSLSY